ncbi:MAG TPA: NADH-quinone oxidoreductase subunit N [Gemmatimonadaceae bacterium]|nr:NADH-quinone oxidoreductase subunit N [Gemmatimonadaceae bacterium]
MDFDLATPFGLTMALGPDVIVMAGAMVLMLVAAFLKDKPHAQRTVGIGAIVVCVIALGAVLMYAMGGRTASSGPVAVDPFRWAVDIIVLVATIGSLALGIDDNDREQINIAETHVLMLFATSGMMLLAAARDLMVLFLALELMSISTYVMCGINRRSPRAAESALKYFLLGSFSTGFLLFGIALTYGATGSTELNVIASAVAGGLGERQLLLNGGIALMLIGFGFKVSAAPFHMWAPDVYEGAPTAVTAYMAAGVKAAAFAAMLRVWTEAFPGSVDAWRGPLTVVAVTTMIVGSIVALPQRNVKRMLAYSSIVHSGYILIAALTITETGRSAYLFYLVSYTLATLGSFGVVGAVSKQNEGKLNVLDYSGLWHERPWLAMSMGIYMFALLGFPVFGGTGFFAKWYMLDASLAGPLKMPGVATALVLTSCVSAGFYLYLVTLMFMKERPTGERVGHTGQLTRVVIGATALAIVFLGVFSSPLIRWAEEGSPMTGISAPVAGVAESR